ncbi:hypothetical protein SAMN05421767_11625 [Granulicatella balaenopterae]|uniref:Uncharacterized protein n=1 Tax=Granulicatella balaenopterae TaxID=137733 RepID=A0A1H9KZT6_9LACT|nr:DUF6442 family protein [Granulicatella balaenopterae]SER04435.1 hypothetical protein SAMN05421767_11625 [Granulicatella balaenopterae]
MDKEKLLSRSRDENIFGDERVRHTKAVSYQWGAIAASLAFIILIIASYFTDIDTRSGKLVFACMLFGQLSYTYWAKRKEATRFSNIVNLLMVGGFFILIIGFIVELIQNG